MTNKRRKAAQRLIVAYGILMEAAAQRRIVTYGEIAVAARIASQAVGKLCLEPLAGWCANHCYPDITYLVGYKKTGLPAEGRYDPAKLHSERERAFRFDWTAITPPSINGELPKPPTTG